MGVIRVVSATLLGLTACMFAASAGQAADSDGGTSFGFEVTPRTVKPGGRITLTAQDCPHAVRVSSGVFDTATIPKGRKSARATVDWDARAGAMYQITFKCGNETGVTDLAVGGNRPSRPAASPAPAAPKRDGNTARDGNTTDDGTYRMEDEEESGRQNGQDGRRSGEQGGRHNGQVQQQGDEHDGHDTDAVGITPGDPQPPQHGARAGAGGTLAGFDRHEFGVGAALVVATFGAAYHFAHRRPDEKPCA